MSPSLFWVKEFIQWLVSPFSPSTAPQTEPQVDQGQLFQLIQSLIVPSESSLDVQKQPLPIAISYRLQNLLSTIAKYLTQRLTPLSLP